MIKKIKASDITQDINTSLKFETTKDLEPFTGMIGQERAISSINTAINIKESGYNVYVSGSLGIGKTNYVLSAVKKLAESEEIPYDYCYINNFEDISSPLYIKLEPGEGYELQSDMKFFCHNLINDIQIKLSGELHQKEQAEISERFVKQKNKITNDFAKETAKIGFKLNYVKGGISFSPIVDGKILNESEFAKLPDEKKKYFKENSPKVQTKTLEILKELEKVDKLEKDAITKWEQNITTFIASNAVKNLKIKYKNNLKLQNFFYSMQSDIVNKIEYFKNFEKYKSTPMNPLDNYKVNLIIDNDKTRYAPIVQAKSPNYFDMFGKLEFETNMYGTRTNYSMLKPGLVHKSNGGYLIINIKDFLNQQIMWEALKRVIKNNEITIDASKDIMQPANITSLKPEPIPINTKFILIGSEMHYMKLSRLDPDFKKLFKIKAEFEETYEKNTQNIDNLIKYMAFVVNKKNTKHLTFDACIKTLEYSLKLSSNKDKLSSNLLSLNDIIVEANEIAKGKNITDEDINNAVINKSKRYSLYDENLSTLIKNNSILINTSGLKVGEINGLTVINTGDTTFGKHVKITANTYSGRHGIINIEREVAMSGNTHSKGVFILSGYIGEKFAQDFPLSFTASICFEQLYNGVDGDSASSTELYAILSSLADVPIKQNFAVTGSVNQKGEIQPIGGVSEKIEGYFKICKEKGLENNSVLIPYQNIPNLILSKEIIKAIEEEKFHIYPIKNIEEGIELLTDVKFGNINKKGTISYLVYYKLKKYYDNNCKG